MKTNRAFRKIVTHEALGGVSQADIPELFQTALSEGWVVDGTGAHLLELFRRGYFGARDSFTDLTAYEVAVNGRGVPDWDLAEKGAERAQVLARRAYAFAWMALFSIRQNSDRTVTAYISVGPTMADETLYTASVTFSVNRDDEPPYVDPADLEKVSNAILVLDSTECVAPLPT